jgi:hypothetical protein
MMHTYASFRGLMKSEAVFVVVLWGGGDSSKTQLSTDHSAVYWTKHKFYSE